MLARACLPHWRVASTRSLLSHPPGIGATTALVSTRTYVLSATHCGGRTASAAPPLHSCRRHLKAAGSAATPVWTQRRSVVVDVQQAKQMDAEILAGVQEEMGQNLTDYILTSSPPAYCSSYMTWLADLTGHWPTALALCALSVQPIVIPLLLHLRMRSISVERALLRYTTLLDEYQDRLKGQSLYGEAWRVYRAKRDMLKESGFRLPHKLSLGMFEVPLAACMGAGAAIAAHLHGNMGGWLWVSDLGAADTTLLSPTLFFALYVMRIWAASPKAAKDMNPGQIVFQFSVSILVTLILRDVAAIVFWLGIFHNMCVLPVVFYLRSNTVYRERYVPLMSKSVQAMVERDALGKSLALPHATKVVDRFAPGLDERPLLLPDFDPDKVPAPQAKPALASGDTGASLTEVTGITAEEKRSAVEEARQSAKPKVRRR
ncbi:uncharacterized protein LOC135809998 [Sycon ciliatum]|uniref:uncharacterized protein LOC135809998 n=1 Tax=Sycon ciliatum TaxID=27933 RepID=UPI0031F6D806